MPLVQTRGAASAQGFGEFAQATAVNYIEEVFSTYLYTGNGSTQTITNGIDLSTKGGLVWLKSRSGAENHILTDSARGVAFFLRSDLTNAQDTNSPSLISAFNTTGFGLGVGYAGINGSGESLVSWTFRKQPKFFDVVTYTGNGSGITVNHSLGSVPGCIIVKAFSSSPAVGQNWIVYHRSEANQGRLNETSAFIYSGIDNVTSTSFDPTGTGSGYNVSGVQYVAYLFAHNAGGFGLTGTDNVISCGTFTTDSGGNATVTLGYEPAWLMFKCSSNAGQNWNMLDTMRGWSLSTDLHLEANSPVAEDPGGYGNPTATGFVMGGQGNTQTYIYIAIRRGPMKVPTLGTSVFKPIARTGTGAVAQITGVGFPPDLAINADRTRSASANTQVTDRLRGTNVSVFTNRTDGDLTYTNAITAFGSDGETLGTDATQGAVNVSGNTYINWLFGRAPGFFDEVCYTGTGVARSLSHNLGVAPELAIVKDRNVGSLWYVQNAAMFAAYTGVSPGGYYCVLNTTAALVDGGGNYVYSPTTSTISVDNGVNFNTRTYVAYLFATCAGVSKVGSYTGNGSTQTIDCGFGASGSRFVLIKRTDSTGDWYVWDSARGMISGTDPSLLLNSTAAEVNANSVYAISTGFQIVSTAAGINASAGTYIFLSVA